MKATQKQYEEAIKHYDSGGPSAVFAYALDIGIDEYSHCIDCEEDTPDCDDDCCLVCGIHKPSNPKQKYRKHEEIQRIQNSLRDLRDSDPEDNDPQWYAIIDAIADLTGIKPQ
jgi:hypothetical protein